MILLPNGTTGFNVVMVTDGVGTSRKAWLELAWQQDQVLLTLNDDIAIFSNY